MNAKNWRPFWAAFISLSLFVFSSCKRPETKLGLEIQPEDDFVNLNTTDTVQLVCSSWKEEELQTNNLSSNLLGNYYDPIFGKTFAGIYTQLRLSTNDVDFGDTTQLVIDSLVLSLAYTGRSYGKLSHQTFSVKEVIEDFYIDSTYYSNSSLDVDAEELIIPGQEIKKFNLRDSVQVGEELQAPQVRFLLKNSLAQRIVNASGSSDLANNENFLQFFKGIQIQSLAQDGGVVNIDPVNDNTKMTLYFRDLSDVEPDTLSYDFLVSNQSARFNTFTHDYKGAGVSGLLSQDSVIGDEFCFVQAGASVKVKMTFPNILEYSDNPRTSVNKAELVLPVTIDESSGKLPVPSVLFALRIVPDGDDQFLPDQTSSVQNIDGSYDPINQEYRFNISRYIQQLISGQLSSTGIYLVASNAGVSVNRVVLNGPLKNIDDSSENARLILTFSE